MTLHQLLLTLHILSFAYAMGIGLGNMINFRVARGQAGDIAKGLALHRASMHRYTDIAIATLLVTGGLMLWQAGGPYGAGQWFHIKMLAVVVLVLTYGAIRMTAGQIKRGNMAVAKRMAYLMPIVSCAALAAVVCAVLAFR